MTGLILLMGGVGLTKQSLAILSLLTLGLWLNSSIPRARAALVIAASIVVSFGLGLWWDGSIHNMVVAGYHQSYPLSNYKAQVRWLPHHPLQYLRVMYQSTFTNLFAIVPQSFIGDLGWLDTSLPPIVTLFGFVIIGLATFVASQYEKLSVPKWFRAWMVGVALAFTVAIITLLYLLTTRPHGLSVVGLQGRYFVLPVSLVLLAFSIGKPNLSAGRYQLLSGRVLKASACMLVVMTYVVLVRYYQVGPFLKDLAYLNLNLF
jgi:uncharacterized membrane protein